jgi:Domain of unknown function (DUF4249)
MKRLFAISFIFLLVAVSCTKNIHLNLQNAAGLLVIEGNINNMPGPYTVYLSQTVTYYDSNNVVPVSGGKITIADDAGNKDSLIEVSPGTYHTNTITGIVGRTYHLSVNYSGKQYDAYSTMNAPVAIDSFFLQPAIFGNDKEPHIRIQNPSGPLIYYNAVMYFNNHRQHKVNPVNNQINLGIVQDIRVRTDSNVTKYDTLQAELDVIDKPMYTYWYSLNNSSLSTQAAAPANPVSNISNNALGYFSAYAATRSYMIVADSTQLGYHKIP